MDLAQKKERGSAKITVLIMLLLAVIIYVGSQLFPLYWDHWNFADAVQAALLSALTPPYKDVEAKVRQSVISLLDNMHAQYEKEQVRVTLRSDNKSIQVEVWYARPHHLPFYPNPKRFYLKTEHASLLPISPKTLELPTRPPIKENE